MNSGSFNTSGYQGRYLVFSWTLTAQNFDTNSSVISWTLAGSGEALSDWYESGSFKVVINEITVYSSSARIQLYNGTVVANGELTITHDGDGNKTFTASAEGAIGAVLVNATGSGSWDLPKISREATLTDAPNFTDEQNPTIEYINPSGSYASSLLACISLNEIDDLISWRDIPKNGTRYTFELTETERNILRASSMSDNILPVTFIVKTVIEGETYYSKLDRKMVIVNADPVFSGATYLDTNPITREITDNDQEIIEGLSVVAFDISNLRALKSAVLTSISININGVVNSYPVSGTELVNKRVSFGVVNASDDLEAIVTLIDSRGNTGTLSVPLTILSYSSPSAIISCKRDNNYETNTELVVNAAFSSLDNKNELTIEYQYKEIDGSTWSALTEINNNTPETILLDNTKAWSLRVILTDLISTTTYNLAVERGLPLVFYDRKRRSVGVNCFPSEDEALEVNGVNVFINPDWDETDPDSPAYIRNKPSTTQVQADWTESDPNDPAYIKNKPTIPDPNDFVTIAGNETITGNKDFTGETSISNSGNSGNTYLKVKSFYNVTDNIPAGDKYIGVDMRTKDDKRIGEIFSIVSTNRVTTLGLEATGYNSLGQAQATENLRLQADANGNHSVTVNHPEDWRAAIGAPSDTDLQNTTETTAALYHLGFYLDSNGGLCQVNTI